MRRAVERYLEDPLAEALLRGDVAEGRTVSVRHEKNAGELSFETRDIPGRKEDKKPAASK